MKRFLIPFAIVIVSLLIALELGGYALIYAMPDLFDDSTSALSDYLATPQAAAKFDDFMKYNFSITTGWMDRRWAYSTLRDCLGGSHRMTQDGAGDRIYKGYAREKAQVLLIGDSYTYGDELGDEETVAADIYRSTGMIVANLGGRGFDPTQSVMRLRARLQDFPQARMVILGIMYEDIHRLVNSYRGLGFKGSPFFFKPYMEDGTVRSIPITAYSSLSAMRNAVIAAQQDDYWALPPHRFPYSLSLITALSSNQFIIYHLDKALHDYRAPYETLYRNTYLGDNLLVLLSYYAQWAKSAHLVPAVVFIPPRPDDTTSANFWIAKYRAQLPSNLIVENLDFSGIDPQKYNISTQRKCHPSAYGAAQIARQYVPLIQQHGLLLRELLYDLPVVRQYSASRH